MSEGEKGRKFASRLAAAKWYFNTAQTMKTRRKHRYMVFFWEHLFLAAFEGEL